MRSTATAERLPPAFSHPIEKKPVKVESASQFSIAWLERLTALLPSKQKNTLWSSRRYFLANELNKTSEECRTAIHNQLAVDLRSFFDEYAAFMPVVRYEYGVNGIMNGYSQSMSEISANHLEDLREKGMPLERAAAELSVAKAVEAWMNTPNLPVGARFMAVSPRGSKSEGYPGLHKKNYIFINFFEKTEDGFALQQYRSYEPNRALPAMQQQLQQATNGEFLPAVPEQPQRQDLQVITNLLSIPPSAEISDIEEILFANKESWPIKIEKLPQLDANRYQVELQSVISFCLTEFDELSNLNLEPGTEIDRYDLLISTVKESFIKWVEDHATNYHKEMPEDYSLNFEELKNVWQARAAAEEGTVLTSEDKKLLKHFKAITQLNPHLPLRGLTSWAHCISGTPFSLTAKMLKLNINQVNAVGLLSGAKMNAELSMMSAQEKTELQKHLTSLIRLQIGPEVWYVPPDYLEEKGCYWDAEQQLAMGPCDIPLNQDPLVMTEAAYLALLEALLAADLENDPSLSTADKIMGHVLLKKTQAKLFKSSISIDTLINNDVLDRNTLLGPELAKLQARLDNSLNPALELLIYIKSLIMEHDDETIRTLELECEESHHHSAATGKVWGFPNQPMLHAA